MTEPLMHQDGRALARHLTAGLALGTALSALMLGLALAVANRLLAGAVGSGPRIGLLVAVLAALAVADALGRTPQRRRQVPQQYLHGARSRFGLGLVWGADLGLMVTTRKATSLGWAALAIGVLTGPAPLAAAVPVVYGLSYVAAVGTVSRWPRLGADRLVFGLASAHRDERLLRALSGLALLGGAGALLAAGRG